MIVKQLLWLLVPMAFAVADWYQIEKKGKYINHLVEFILRGIVAIVYGGLVFDAQPGAHGAYVLLFEISSFYLLFEFLLNILRRKGIAYLGKEAAIDKFLSRRRWLYWTLKLAVLAGTIISSIYLLNYEA